MKRKAFPCGHPRSAKNTVLRNSHGDARPRCRTCVNRYQSAYMQAYRRTKGKKS